MVNSDGKSTMLGQWRIALRQADEAARAGRLDEALRLASKPEVADHHHAVQLRGKLAMELIARAARRGEADDLTGAIDDLRVAEGLHAPPDALAATRLALAERVAAEVRADLDLGEPGRVAERIEELARFKIGGPALRRAREVAEAWKNALDEARRGEFGRAYEQLDRADRLAGETAKVRPGLGPPRRSTRGRRPPPPRSRPSTPPWPRGDGPRPWPPPRRPGGRPRAPLGPPGPDPGLAADRGHRPVFGHPAQPGRADHPRRHSGPSPRREVQTPRPPPGQSPRRARPVYLLRRGRLRGPPGAPEHPRRPQPGPGPGRLARPRRPVPALARRRGRISGLPGRRGRPRPGRDRRGRRRPLAGRPLPPARQGRPRRRGLRDPGDQAHLRQRQVRDHRPAPRRRRDPAGLDGRAGVPPAQPGQRHGPAPGGQPPSAPPGGRRRDPDGRDLHRGRLQAGPHPLARPGGARSCSIARPRRSGAGPPASSRWTAGPAWPGPP